MPIKVYVRQATSGRNHQLFYVDPGTGKRHHKSSGTRDTRAAQRAAARWEDELNRQGNAEDLPIEIFRQKFDDEKLIGVSDNARITYTSALNRLEDFTGSQYPLSQVNARTLSQLQAKMKRSGLSDASVATYLRHIRCAMSWGVTMGYLSQVPKVVMPKTTKRRMARGRPLTWQEVVRFIHAIDVPEADRRSWEIFVRGLYLSGLRLSEAISLSFDEPPVMLDFKGGRESKIIWYGEGQKSRNDEVTPITRKFAALVKRLPKTGHVLRPTYNGKPASKTRASVTLCNAGRAAKIKTPNGRTATAHDFRRSFGQYWATKLKPLELQKLMRHSSLDTTLKYYVDLPIDNLTDVLWK